MKEEKRLMNFVMSLWDRGLLAKTPEELDYEWVIWDYLKRQQPADDLPDFLYQDDGQIKIGYRGDSIVTDKWNEWKLKNGL